MSSDGKNKFLKLIQKAFVQFLPIAVGVYVGIVAGNWNEDSKLRKTLKTFLKNVITELEGNVKRLDWAL